MPKTNTWWGGVQVNSILEHDLNHANGKMKSNQYFINLSYGIRDWLCIDGKIGLGDIEYETGISDDMDYNTNFAGGYGFRVRVFNDEKRKLTGIFGFQHISVHPEHIFKGAIENTVIYDDWQISLLMSKQLGRCLPYLGGKLSTGDLVHREGDERHRLKPENILGLVIGMDVMITDNTRFNIEGRFFDETAVNCGVSLKI